MEPRQTMGRVWLFGVRLLDLQTWKAWHSIASNQGSARVGGEPTSEEIEETPSDLEGPAVPKT
ncbi:MAG: hypothetical protein ACI835_003401 [Planctomycetota bacterium]